MHTPTPAFPPEYTALIDPHGTIDELTRLRAQVAQLQRALVEVQSKTASYIAHLEQQVADNKHWKTRALEAENTAMIARGYASNIMDATRDCARR